ncbi:DEAD/DEAH box helicase [Streptomyces sp. NPDC058221]|uniref:DEAD/DEAH box helicase n=1 Tax=Streptomyces sp. NPDC058221 TaxID=3346388 RepID=UPI0036E78960
MVFDFSKLSTGDPISDITDPTDLFDALPNKKRGYGYLRAVQQSVLDAWAARRDEHDVVIKTNTGGGKTVVGLVILQCCLNEKKGPALYLVPTPDLARRVREEADNLGLPTVDDPEKPAFLRGEAICVTTMNVLINGKSRFGIVGGFRQPVTVGSVVVDDAHAALAMTEEKTRLRIPGDHPAYGALLDIFEDDLKAQSLNGFKDVQAQDSSAAVPCRSGHGKTSMRQCWKRCTAIAKARYLSGRGQLSATNCSGVRWCSALRTLRSCPSARPSRSSLVT